MNRMSCVKTEHLKSQKFPACVLVETSGWSENPYLQVQTPAAYNFDQKHWKTVVLQHLVPLPPNPDLDRDYLEEEVDPSPKK